VLAAVVLIPITTAFASESGVAYFARPLESVVMHRKADKLVDATSVVSIAAGTIPPLAMSSVRS
jgi:hypothetical protein